jgi:hypothetical protein
VRKLVRLFVMVAALMQATHAEDCKSTFRLDDHLALSPQPVVSIDETTSPSKSGFPSDKLKATTSPQYEIDVSFVGSALWSCVYDVVVRDNYAYCAMTYGLMIFDISNLSAPVPVAKVDLPTGYSRYGRGLALAGNYAYLADGSAGLQIIDIANPLMPQWVGAAAFDGATCVAVSGSYAFVAGPWDRNIHVYDVSTPQSPQEICQVSMGLSTWITGLTTQGDYVYVSTLENALVILDISDPVHPVIIGTCYIPGMGWNVAVDGNVAYVASDYSGLQIVDVTNPSTPVPMGGYPTSTKATDVAVFGSVALLATGTRGLKVLDVSNPHTPQLLATCSIAGSADAITVSGDIVLVGDKSAGLTIVDVTAPQTPAVIGTYAGPGRPWSVAVSANHAFVCEYLSGMRIVDITNPQLPLNVSGFDTAVQAVDVALSSDYAFLTNGNYFEVVNVSDPNSPSMAGSIHVLGGAGQLAVSGRYAYVAAHSDLVVIDASQPNNPRRIGSCGGLGSAFHYDVATHDDYAYIASDDYPADNDDGVKIVNVANPTAPYLAGNYLAPGARGVTLEANLVYIACGSGIDIVNVSNPATPQLVGRYNSGQSYSSIAVQGKYAYVAMGNSVDIINVSDTQSPYLAGRYQTPSTVRSMVVNGNYTYVADWDGFLILATPICGNVDNAGTVDISDVVFLIQYLFTDGAFPSPLATGDINCDGRINIADAVYLINYIFRGGPQPCAGCK